MPSVLNTNSLFMKLTFLPIALIVALPGLSPAAGQLTITAVNKLQLARPSQTIEVSGKDLGPLEAKSLETVHVKDSSGKELVCQAVDMDFDELHKPDMVIFQADFAPGETKTFAVSVGKKHEYKRDDFKAYGRFVRERFDDFAWENDLIAHRTYGTALITWKGEPLTSSSIDIWSKRTPKMVINDWYMMDNYSYCQAMGSKWLNENKTAVLKVPSVIIKKESNFLINQNHPDFKKISLSGNEDFDFDNRF